MTDDLAGGFQSVDAATDFAVFSSCLTLIDSLPFFAECKRVSYELVGAAPGRRILEVGCGLGDNAASLARLVAPGGSVVRSWPVSRGQKHKAYQRRTLTARPRKGAVTPEAQQA